MFCSSKLKTTPRGGESPPYKTPPVPPGASGVDQALADKLLKISVRGAPHQTHTLHLKRSDTMADVNAAVERLGYDLSVDRLCRFGGASLPQDDHVTLAESGLQPNSSLHVLGRVRGGAEVPLFGQQHSLGDTGLLDLMGQDVGPAKLKEVAAFFSSPESSAVRRLILSGNMLTDRGKGLSGLKALCEVLPTLKHPISLDLAGCGLGVAEVNELAQAIHAGAALNSVTVDSTGNTKDRRGRWNNGGPKTYTLTVGDEKIDLSNKNLGSADVALLAAWLQRPEVSAALNSVTVDSTGDTKDRLGRWNNGGPKTYTLTVGDEKIDLSSKNLGSAGVALVAVWLQRPEVSAAVEAIAIGANPIKSEGGAILLEAIKTSKLKTIDIGKPLPLQEPYESDTLDLSHTTMDPGHVLLLSWWLGTEFSAAVEAIAIGANPITSEGGAILLETIKTSKLKTIDIGKPLPLQEPCESDTLDLSNTQMDPGHVLLLSWWLGTEFSAALNSVTVDSTGDTKDRLGRWNNGGPETYTLTVGDEKIDLSSKNLGSADVALVAVWLQRPEVSAALTSVNCLANNFGDDDVATLLTAIEGTSVRSLCGLTEGQTIADFSNQNLKPMDCKIIAAEFGFRGFIAAVARLMLDGNPLTGGTSSSDFDKDITSVMALFDSLKTSSVTELGLAKCRLGPGSLGKLAEYVRDAEAAVARLILDGNPLTGGRYESDFDKDITGVSALCDTLKTSPVTELSLVKCRLGPGSLGKLAEYVREATAALTSVNCLANNFGDDDVATLLTAIEGTSVRSLCGLTEGQTIADFSNQNLKPMDCKIIAAEFGFRGFIAAVARLMLDGNLLTGGTRPRDFDKDITGVTALFDSLKTSSVTELGLAKCRLGPGSLGKLVEYVRDAEAAIARLSLSGNKLGCGALVKDYMKTVGLDAWYQFFERYLPSNLETIQRVRATTDTDLQRMASEANMRLDAKTTQQVLDALKKEPKVGTQADISGLKELFGVLSTLKSPISLDLANCDLGVAEVNELARAIQAGVTLISINCLANTFGDDALATLLTAIEGTSVRSLCGLTEGQTTADFSGQNLGPIDMKIMAAEYGFQGFIAAVARLILNENPLTGGRRSTDFDTDITGITALCDTLKTSSVTELGLAKCRLGPGSLGKLAEYVRDADAALNSVTVDSTGDTKDRRGRWNNGGPKTYTLTVGDEKIDLSSKNLGSADVALVAVWLQRPEVSAALNSVTVDSTGVMKDEYGRTGQGTQKTYTLTVGEEKIDLRQKNLGSADVALVATWLQRSEVSAAVEAVALSKNKLGGHVATLAPNATTVATLSIGCFVSRDGNRFFEVVSLEPVKLKNVGDGQMLDQDIPLEALQADDLHKYAAKDVKITHPFADLCKGLLVSRVSSLDLSECELGSGDLTELAEYVRDAEAAIARLSLSGNKLGCGALVKDYMKTVGLDAWYQFFERHLPSNLETIQRVRATTDTDLQRMASEANMRLDAKTTQQVLDALKKEPKVGTQADISGLKELFGVLSTLKSPISLDLANCDLGVAEVNELARAIQAGVTLISINCLANTFGDDALATLLTAIEGTSVRSLCGLTEGQTTADFSGQNLGPIDMKIMAAEYGFQGFIAAVTSLNCENNLAMVGELKSYGYYLKTADVHAGVFKQLTDALKTSQVTEVNFSACGIGPIALGHLSEWVREATAAVTSLNCENNLAMVGELESYGYYLKTADVHAGVFKQLTDGLKTSQVTEADFSACGLGPVALGHLSEWVRDAEAAVEAIAIAANPITSEGGAILLEAIKTSNLKTIDIGKPLPLQEPYDSDTLDLSDTQMDPGHVLLLSWWLGTEFSAAVTSMNCLHNPLGEGARTIIKVFEETTRLRTLCWLEEGVEHIDWSDSDMGPADVALLAAEIKAGRATTMLQSLHMLSTGTRRGPYTLATTPLGNLTSELTSRHLSEEDAQLFSSWLSTKVTEAIELEPPLVLYNGRLGAELGYAKICANMVWEDFMRWLGLSDDQQKLFADDGFCMEKLLQLTQEDIDEDIDDYMDDATKQRMCNGLVLLKDKCQSDGERYEKVQWRDDDIISDWIVADALQRKQQLSPFDAAIKWKLPTKVLSHIAHDLDGGLEKARSYTGMTFYHLLLGSEVPGYSFFARTFGTFQPRQDLQKYYKIVGSKVHASETCLVIFAVDVLSDREVALKLMVHKEQWQREADLRKKGPTGILDAAHVVELLATIELDEAGLAHCRTDDRLCGLHTFRYMHVMPRANRDLSDLLSHDRVAGYDIVKATSILRQVAIHLHYLHVGCKMIHGDIKSRNLVETTLADSAGWILIDLDAACAINSKAGQKITSSAFFPPEMARYEMRKQSRNAKAIPPLATEAFEMWYFGLMVSQLSTRDAPSLWQSTQADNLVKAEDMKILAYFWDTVKLEKLRDITSSGQQWVAAADLALWLLQAKASRRPASMQSVLEHRFFKLDGKLRYFESVDETLDSLVQRQAEKLTAAIASRDSVAVKEMFDHGDVHLRTLDASIAGSTVTPLMRAAFVGETATIEVLLGELDTEWPQDVLKVYLDQRTSLDFTAYMIACACGHKHIADLLEAKGCSICLVNAFGQAGNALLQAAHEEHESSHLRLSYKTCKSLEAYLTLLDRKSIVMSCPEKGTLDPKGIGPYDERVMDKINELRLRGKLKGGFDRAGSSNMDPRDNEIWPKVCKTEGQEHLFETDEEKRKELIKSTYWFTGYRTAAKAQMNLECQTFDGTLEVICIKGGPITNVEHEEMQHIIEEAKHDAFANGIKTNIQLKKVGYLEFLREYDPDFLHSKIGEPMPKLEPEPQSQREGKELEPEPELELELEHEHEHEHEPEQKREQTQENGGGGGSVEDVDARDGVSDLTDHEKAMETQLKETRAQLAAKDHELKTKDEEVHGLQEELKQLRAQLKRLEGVPPQRD